MEFRNLSLYRSGVKPTYRIMTAYSIFVRLCKEEHDKMFPGLMLDPALFERKTSERWKSLTEREKKWFVLEEIKTRKVKSLSPVKTSTPVRPPTKKPGRVQSSGVSTKKVISKPSSNTYNPFEKKKPSAAAAPPQAGGSRQINQIRASLNLQPLRPDEHLKVRAVKTQNPRPRMFAVQDSKGVRDV